MRVYFHELNDTYENFQIHYFGNICNRYTQKEFYKLRRVFRDRIINRMLQEKDFILDENGKKIYTINDKKNFSCSYTGFYIAVGLSDYKIGIDIEDYNKISADKIHIFSSDYELSLVQSEINCSASIATATLVWCCKESLGKLFNVGLARGFKAFEFYYSVNSSLNIKKNFDSNNYDDVHIYYKLFDYKCFVICSFHRLERSYLC